MDPIGYSILTVSERLTRSANIKTIKLSFVKNTIKLSQKILKP